VPIESPLGKYIKSTDFVSCFFTAISHLTFVGFFLASQQYLSDFRKTVVVGSYCWPYGPSKHHVFLPTVEPIGHIYDLVVVGRRKKKVGFLKFIYTLVHPCKLS
jgi:hypothetical protein